MAASLPRVLAGINVGPLGTLGPFAGRGECTPIDGTSLTLFGAPVMRFAARRRDISDEELSGVFEAIVGSGGSITEGGNARDLRRKNQQFEAWRRASADAAAADDPHAAGLANMLHLVSELVELFEKEGLRVENVGVNVIAAGAEHRVHADSEAREDQYRACFRLGHSDSGITFKVGRAEYTFDIEPMGGYFFGGVARGTTVGGGAAEGGFDKELIKHGVVRNDDTVVSIIVDGVACDGDASSCVFKAKKVEQLAETWLAGALAAPAAPAAQ